MRFRLTNSTHSLTLWVSKRSLTLEEVMRLTIFAATGGVGRHLLSQALDAGHDVTVVVRNPNKLPAGHERLRVVTADLAGRASLEPALEGADAALSGLGAGFNADVGVASRGTG